MDDVAQIGLISCRELYSLEPVAGRLEPVADAGGGGQTGLGMYVCVCPPVVCITNVEWWYISVPCLYHRMYRMYRMYRMSSRSSHVVCMYVVGIRGGQ